MRSRTRWLYLIAGLAVAFVATSVIVQGIAHGSWSPAIAAWIPAVTVVAIRPGASRRCQLGRRRTK